MIENPTITVLAMVRLGQLLVLALVMALVTYFLSRRHVAHGVMYFRIIYAAAVGISVASVLAALAGSRAACSKTKRE